MDVFRSLHMLYTKLTDKLSSRINLTDSLRVVGNLRRLRHLQTAEDIQTQQNNRTNKDNYDQLDDQDKTDTTLKLNEGKQIHEIFYSCVTATRLLLGSEAAAGDAISLHSWLDQSRGCASGRRAW